MSINLQYLNVLQAVLFFLIFTLPAELCSQSIGLSIVSGDAGCSPLEVCFQNNSDPAGIVNFEWDWNNDGIADSVCGPENAGATVCHIFNENPYLVRVFLTGIRDDGTTDGAFVTISVYNPNTAILGPLPNLVCSGQIELLNNSTINDDGSFHLTIWDFGDGSPVEESFSTSIMHEFIVEGNITISMTDSNSCGSNTITRNINVNLLNTNIITDTGNETCQGVTVQFSNEDHSTSMNYEWNFGDGSTSSIANPQHMFMTQGNFTVSVSVNISDGIGCDDNTTYNITVLPGPIAEFSLIKQEGCDSAQVDFDDLSIEVISGDEYFWDFDNGSNYSEDTSPISTFYDSSGYYYPSLTITRNSNSCSSVFVDTVLIPPTPTAAFSVDNVCLGQTALFYDASVVNITPVISWNWDFGGGLTSTDQNPSVIFTDPGTRTVILEITTDYCTNASTSEIVVEDLPHPSFTINQSSGCSPLQINYTNATSDAISFLWDFGDGESDTVVSPVHEFINNSTSDTVFITKLFAYTAFGCTDSLETSIKIFSVPEALFSSDAPENPSCYPQTITFTSLTENAASILWDFGDGNFSGDSVATHTYINEEYYFQHFEVMLVAESDSGCIDTSETVYISLYPKPRTDFVMDTSNACHPANISIYAPIETDAGYFWDFGDGDTLSTNQFEIVNQFLNPSVNDTVFMIELTTISQFGCIDSSFQYLTHTPFTISGF